MKSAGKRENGEDSREAGREWSSRQSLENTTETEAHRKARFSSANRAFSVVVASMSSAWVLATVLAVAATATERGLGGYNCADEIFL